MSTNGLLLGTNLNVMIAADPQYTNNPLGVGRQFSGQVCEVALFTNALTTSQLQALYNAAGVAPYITTQPVSASVNQGAAFTNTVVAGGSATLAYQWYQGTAPLSGQTAASLVLNPVVQASAGSYFVVITNNAGAVTSSVVSLTVFASPLITSQLPVTYTNLYTLYAGSSPTFSLVSVAGAVPLYYQWYTNGVKDAAGTNSTYKLNNVGVGFITNYCVVTNSIAAATSFVWTASVVPAPGAPYPQSALSLNPVGFWRLNEADDGLSDGNPGAIAHDYVEGNDGVYTNTTLGQTGYSLGLANQYGNPSLATDPATTSASFGNLSSVDSDVYGVAGIDFAAPTNTSRTFSIAAWANGASTQVSGAGIVSKGYGNGGEQFDLDVYNYGARFFVRDASGASHGVTTSLRPDGNWHYVVAVCDEVNGAVSLYIDGQLAGQGSIPAGAGLLAATDLMTIGARRSGVSVTHNDLQFQGYINDVAVYNYALSAAQVVSNYLSAGVAPQIAQQPPASASVGEGGTLTITAAALGTAPLVYQWQDNSGPLAGQTNATLVLSNVPAGLNGDSFSLTVTNLYGAATTMGVSLNVITGPPQIIASNLPPQVLLPLGKSVHLLGRGGGHGALQLSMV